MPWFYNIMVVFLVTNTKKSGVDKCPSVTSPAHSLRTRIGRTITQAFDSAT